MKFNLGFLVLLASTSAWATLGQPIDRSFRLEGVQSNFTVHTIDSGAATVREYVNSSGVVFGLAWNGLTHPDLSSLLGNYANEYQEKARQHPQSFGRRSSSVNTGRVVVEKWGHMRSMKGRAYDPALLPRGMNADEIK